MNKLFVKTVCSFVLLLTFCTHLYAVSNDTCFDTDTKLMLHLDGADGAAADVITANGNAQVDTAQSQFGGASSLFDGTGDYLSIPDSADWDLLAADAFTIDFWIRFNGSVAQACFFDRGTEANYTIYYKTGEFTAYLSGALVARYTMTPSANTWYHIAFVKTGNGTNGVTLYVNGTAGEQQGTHNTAISATNPIWIGERQDGFFAFNGWIDEVRFIKGTAVWTSNFTPPVSEYSRTDVTDNTKLLIHSNGTDASTIFYDSSLYDSSASNNNLVFNGNTQIDTAQSKFGGESVIFATPATSTDYISIPDSSDFNVASGDSTLEFWIRPSTSTNTAFIIGQNSATQSERANISGILSDNTLFCRWSNSTTNFDIFSSSTISDNTWGHVACIRTGNTGKLFVNGTQSGGNLDLTGVTVNDSSQPLLIGRYSGAADNGFDGWVDEIRLVKGTAIWTSNFTPPSSAYSDTCVTRRRVLSTVMS